MMHEYMLRVRRTGDTYTATIRELSPGQHPEALAMIGPESSGEGANAPAAMVSAIGHAQIPTFVESPRRAHVS